MTTVLPTHIIRTRRVLFVVFALLAIAFQWVSAAPIGADQSRKAVENWLRMERHPMRAKLGTTVKSTETFKDKTGQPLYHVVYLSGTGTQGGGFVIVAGDDQIEPIVAFCEGGRKFDPDVRNPLGAMVSQDVPQRLAQARKVSAMRATKPTHVEQARQKWSGLLGFASGTLQSFGSTANSSISDIRVDHLLNTAWDQLTVDDQMSGNRCYNYYTPNNDYCGCVATAMSQLMRYYKYPTQAVKDSTTGRGPFTVTVEVEDQSGNIILQTTPSYNLLGGDSSGGAYKWDQMDLHPDSNTTDSDRAAIGALTFDAGLASGMDYSNNGSGAWPHNASAALKSTFFYSNSICIYSLNSSGYWACIPAADLLNMVNPNLDAKFPVLFGINGTCGGHCIACDGYGYNGGTMYYHLNMGWGGAAADQNAWYSVPPTSNINNSNGDTYTIISACLFNIYTNGDGEIISGRITDSNGNPLPGATVTASGGSGTFNSTSDANGIYALAKIPSNSTYTVTASEGGYPFSSQTVTLGKSSDAGFEITSSGWTPVPGRFTSANQWGIDFKAAMQLPPSFTQSANSVTVINGSTVDLGSVLEKVVLTASSTVSIRLTAANAPTSITIDATGLPGNLTYTTPGNPAICTITGQVTQIGTFNASVVASNAFGSGSGTLAIVVNPNAVQAPNLTPCAPGGWSDKIVVTKAPGGSFGSCQDAPAIYTGDSLYVDWAVINNGLIASNPYSVALFVDGTLSHSWLCNALSPDWVQPIYDYPIGVLSTGTHALQIVADSGNQNVESNETDNSYTKSIVVSFPPTPWTIATNSYPVTGGTTLGAGVQIGGSTVSVTAVPAPGYTFLYWTEGGAVVSRSANYSFTVSGNRALTAVFWDGSAYGNWQPVSQGTQSNTLRGVAFGNGMFVAVGDGGTILFSSDGATWTRAGSGILTTLNTVQYLNNLFVAAGEGGEILVSNNGVTWSPEYTSSNLGITSVAFGGGQFAAAGFDKVQQSFSILKSADGRSWSVAKTFALQQDSNAWVGKASLAYGNGLFRLDADQYVGGPQTAPFILFNATLSPATFSVISGSGTEDTTSAGVPRIGDFFLSGTFVGTNYDGSIGISVDGTNWNGSVGALGTPLNGAVYGNGSYIVVGGSGTVITSSDLQAWNARPTGSTGNLYAVAYGNGIAVAVGDSGAVLTASGSSSSVCNITASAFPSNGGSVTGAVNYLTGAHATIAAVPSTGFRFQAWTESGTTVAISGTYGFTATRNRSFVAQFVPDWQQPTGLESSMTLYAQALQNGLPINTAGSMLAAFDSDGECIGSATLVNGPAGMEFEMQLWNNRFDVAGITFKVFDAASGNVYDLAETLEFVADEFAGAIDAPKIFHTNTEQTISVTHGWNWISFNVLPDDKSVQSVLRNYHALENDVIKSNGSASATYSQNQWWSTPGFVIDPNSGYALFRSATDATQLGVQGLPVDPTVSIPLVVGWNFIGFLPQQAMAVDDALKNFQAVNGDVVKSDGGFATYSAGVSGTGWYPSVEGYLMEPGMGYKIHSSSAQSLSFNSGTASSSAFFKTFASPSVQGNVSVFDAAVNPGSWVAPVGRQYSMTVYAEVTANGVPIGASGSVLAAFENGTCAGVVAVASSPSGVPVFQLQVWSDQANSQVSYQVYDGQSSQVFAVNQTSNFVPDATLGTISAPSIFTTPNPPSVTGGSASSVTGQSAVLNGNINPNGAATTYVFQYGLQKLAITPTYESSSASHDAGSGQASAPASGTISSLTPGTAYHFRVVATSARGTSYGQDVIFTTPDLPGAVTVGASSVTAQSTVLNGTVNPEGVAASYYFEYGSTSTYGNSTAVQNAGSGQTSAPASTTLSGLLPGQTYHFRLVATSAGGVAYGQDALFVTQAAKPSGVTGQATDVTYRSAGLCGTVDAMGAETSYYFQYGATAAYGRKSSIQSLPADAVATAVLAAISGLQYNTHYHYRIVATNSNGTVYGADRFFKTTVLPPSALTERVTAITRKSASLHGTVSPRASSTVAYFEYGLTTMYGSKTGTKTVGHGNEGVSIEATLGRLKANTVYHCRAVARNEGGYAFGKDRTFKTKE